MSKSKHSEAQIIAALKQVEAGRATEDVARDCGVSKHTDKQIFQDLVSLPVNQPNVYKSIELAESIRARNKGKRLITDDNMGYEWPAIGFHVPPALNR